MTKTFRGVVFHGVRDIRVEDRPFPTAETITGTDAVVKVTSAGLCGSDLHAYRGHEKRWRTGFIIGHEFVGKILMVGTAVQEFTPGDHIVSPFTSSCGKCFYCLRGFTSRCENCGRFGAEDLDGGQAEIVVVPDADATLFHLPTNLKPELAILMADIFPTGWYAGTSALKDFTSEQLETDTVVVVGCGPVPPSQTGLIPDWHDDSNPARLKTAPKHGANPLDPSSDLHKTILAATGNRGADIVIEAVGHGDTLRLAFELLRPFGLIMEIGVPQDPLPFSGQECYAKNLRIQFGRCPARAVFQSALKMLVEVQDELVDFVEVWKGLDDAPRAYELFDRGQVGKIAFQLN